MARGLDGKIAIITGSAQGIGKDIAAKLMSEGCIPVISDIQTEKGEATAAELGTPAIFIPCDIGNVAQVRALIDTTAVRFGRLDIMVNNAAPCGSHPSYANVPTDKAKAPIHEFSDDVWNMAINIGLTGSYYGCKYAAAQMVKQKSGVIINIASVAGVVALRNQITNCAIKAALIKMTEAMACELGGYGVRVNAVSPGSTVTEPTREQFYGPNAIWKEMADRLLSFVPLGRPAETSDMAAAVAFLASDDAAYITGHNLIVDGGWTSGFNRDF
jgi:3-oxoacyl-[acyl-carrier protein] reductase